ncbi:TlpA family protein disulfide reductase [Sphingobacterium faecale]|uniref:Redoxin domain-containing protein n=1 Tax=Sphingobacterium faecale TaxID=2803775 RepID=A0ABS1R9X8_9SPHI|nr:redoxin domain-containing protein [Sphingobacterium faecale]MBL1411514.1 redoxin domain-containing protein [Sphingobacterium faecale]
MKNTFIIFLLILLCRQVNAQYKALQIGDKMPDFEFAIQNYEQSTAKISDFKGKLVFFDFWSTYCSSCIAGFPRMEKLQKEFGDKIIIILVNIRETQDEVAARLKTRKSIAPELTRMPSIIDEQVFAQLFPHQFAGNYVWIDPEGVLRLNTSLSKNIHAKKIQEVLDGKEISFLTSGQVYGLADDEPTLLKIINQTNPNGSDIYSFFAPVNLDYYPMGGQKLNQIDTVLKTVRNTFINRRVAELYSYALLGSLEQDWKSNVYGPNQNYYKINRFSFEVKDIFKYDNWIIPKYQQTDEYVIHSLYCYEQVLPQTVSTKQASQYMKEDLDRYFGIRYGSKVTIEENEIPCYYLKKVDNRPKLSEKEIEEKMKALKYEDLTLIWDYNSLLNNYFRLAANNPYVFLGEDVPIKCRAVVPNREEWKKVNTFQDFQRILEFNNLTLVKGTKKINMIIVRD